MDMPGSDREVLGLSNVGRSVGDYDFFSRPNRSLSPDQQRWVFWSVALPGMGIAVFFAALGYWLMLPFAGFEIGLLAWAFDSLREHDGDYESITIRGDCLCLEWREAGKTYHRDLNTLWTSVESSCEQAENRCRFCLRSSGETTELGRYLSDQGRLKLAEVVRAKLSRRPVLKKTDN